MEFDRNHPPSGSSSVAVHPVNVYCNNRIHMLPPPAVWGSWQGNMPSPAEESLGMRKSKDTLFETFPFSPSSLPVRFLRVTRLEHPL